MALETPAATSDRPAFPTVEADIGEDPARFLYHEGDALGTDSIGDSSPLQLAEARIRGIDFLAVARAWLGVARRLNAEGHLSETALDIVADRLQERIEFLEDHGDRDDRMARQGRREIDQARIEAKRERDPLPDHRGESATSKLSRKRADGGEDR